MTLEALLLVAETPPTIRTLARVTGAPTSAVETIIAEMEADDSGGIRLRRHEDTIALVSAPDAAPYVERLLGLDTPPRLSKAALETLAVIAYHQPVTRDQIERVRGVGASGVIRSLRTRDLIAPSGRLDSPGQPLLWSVTARFLDHFGLSALEQLPSLDQLEPPAQQALLPLEPGDDS
jgi:segregation and condensation protein B